jgi:hypothetical protein
MVTIFFRKDMCLDYIAPLHIIHLIIKMMFLLVYLTMSVNAALLVNALTSTQENECQLLKSIQTTQTLASLLFNKSTPFNLDIDLDIIALNLAFMEREWNAPLEKYKDIFGKPGTGAHAHRIANIAIVDVLITLLVAAIIGFLSYRNWIDKLLMTIFMFFGLFILSIFIHRLFGFHTTINDAFFP